MSKFFLWLYIRATGVSNDVTSLIEKHLKIQHAIVVQIGSNDGVSNDPIHLLLQKYDKWSAVLVEPVPYLFERLKNNYGSDPRFRFENTLINDGTSATFFWVSPQAKEFIPDLPYWYDQLGGFSRRHITDHLPQVDPYIEQATLKGTTLKELLQKNRIASIDLLHIDTEGADFEILKQIDIRTNSPRAIIYEWIHLTGSEVCDSLSFLVKDYVLYKFGPDIVAVRVDSFVGLQRIRGRIMTEALRSLFVFRKIGRWLFTSNRKLLKWG